MLSLSRASLHINTRAVVGRMSCSNMIIINNYLEFRHFTLGLPNPKTLLLLEPIITRVLNKYFYLLIVVLGSKGFPG